MQEPNDTLFIKQQDKETDLFFQLQQQSLEDYQRLAGDVWTDYNLHDPGITITDILNYALTELNYRLQFPLQDYLTTKGQPFKPESFGFYLPSRVFPVSPVTTDDYRKYLLSALPEIENIWIIPLETAQGFSGKYAIKVEQTPYGEKSEQEEIIRKLTKLYHAKRNLCEELDSIEFIERENLIMHGDIQIEAGYDALQILAQIYWDAHAFLAGYPHYYYPDTMAQADSSPDEWLDGPLESGLRIDFPGSSCPTETALYKHLLSIPGIISVHSFHLEDANGKTINLFDKFYSVAVPTTPEEIKVSIRALSTPVPINVEKLAVRVRSYYFRHKGLRVRQQEKMLATAIPESSYHAIYKHDTIQDDFPSLYGIGHAGLSIHESDQRKGQAMQLKAYLLLFDLVFARGLDELKEVRTLMQQKAVFPENKIPRMNEPACLWNLLTDENIQSTWEKRTTLHQKEQLADMWDKFYGEDSNLFRMQEFNYYDEVPEETLFRRLEFLKNAPAWGYNRFKACNLYAKRNAKNVPGIKAYITTLLGWECNEGHAVGNLFPVYNMILMSDQDYFEGGKGILKHTIMLDDLLRSGNMEQVPYIPITYSDIHYEELRMELPIFYHNILFESLFRNGIRLENYKIVHIREENDYMLVFEKQDTHTCINLGRFSDKEKLIRTANRLRLFLVSMNRKSETLYIVEHNYFPEPEPFTLTVVLPNWSARMALSRFRETCENLLISHLPAHIQVNFCWLDMKNMWDFELNWSDWRRKYARQDMANAAVVMKKIKEIIQ